MISSDVSVYYTQKAHSGQGSSWNILQEKNTSPKAMGKGRK